MSANLALNKTVTSSSYVAPFSPSRVVDGLTQPVRRWVCDQLPAFLIVDLGEYYWIDHIILRHMGVAGWSSRYNLKGYTLEGSTDNHTWDSIYSISGNTANTNDIAFAPKPARWVKLLVASGLGLDINPNAASLVEMEVYECSSNPYLSNLGISSGTLNPVFNPKNFEYTVEVENNVPSITVTPTAVAAGATITVNDNPVQSGSPSQQIPLNPGTTAIAILVTNGSVQQKYSITVTKKSAAALLSNLTLQSPAKTISLSPGFDSNTFSYTATAPNGTPSVTVTPTVQAAGSTVKVNDVPVTSGSPSQAITTNPGTTSINIDVTSQGGGSVTRYTISVNRTS